MYLSRMLTDESLPAIGLAFGGRDHSTIIYAIAKIEEDLKQNNQLKEIINEIKAKMWNSCGKSESYKQPQTVINTHISGNFEVINIIHVIINIIIKY